MPEITPTLEHFLVRHNRKVVGPLSRNLIEGFVMSGVFPLDAVAIPLGTQDKVRLGSLMSFPPPQATQKPKGLRSYPAHMYVIGLAVTIVLAAAYSAAFLSPNREPEYVSRPYERPAAPQKKAKGPTVVNVPSIASRKPVSVPVINDSWSTPSKSLSLSDEGGRKFWVSSDDYQRLILLREKNYTYSYRLWEDQNRLDDLKKEITMERELLPSDDQDKIDKFNAKVQLFNRDSSSLKSSWEVYNAAIRDLDADLHRVGTLAR